jgi:hypothetical protein
MAETFQQKFQVGQVVRYRSREEAQGVTRNARAWAALDRYTVTAVEGDGYLLIRSHNGGRVYRCSDWRLTVVVEHG